MTDTLLSIQEVADYLGISKRSIYNWRNTGRTSPPAIKVGSSGGVQRLGVLHGLNEVFSTDLRRRASLNAE